MSATTQNNNMDTLNAMFAAFMERAADEGGPFEEYATEVSDSLTAFWMHDDNQALFSKVLGSMKTKTARKSKKSDDDDKPKLRRPKSAYIFFCKEQRPDVVETMTEENGGEKPAPKDVLSRLGAEWKELKGSTKTKDKKLMDKFVEMAAKDKAECHEENGTSPDESKSKSKKKDDGKPKRAKSAYQFFCQDKRAEVKKTLEEENEEKPSAKEINAELSRMWSELKGSKKKADKAALSEYEQMKMLDKNRYDNEMAAFSGSEVETETEVEAEAEVKEVEIEAEAEAEAEDDEVKFETDGEIVADDEIVANDEDKYEKALTELTKTINKGRRKLPDSITKATKATKATESKQKRPTVKQTGYSLYAKEMRAEVKEENPDSKAAEITKMLQEMWKDLDDEEKDEFKERAKVLNES